MTGADAARLPPLTYTLCFLTRGDAVLLLHRTKAPNKGLWNGVGGKLTTGEDPLAGVLREVREETGYVIATARFAGLLTWEGYEVAPGGLYLFTAAAPPTVSGGDPAACDEGTLAWRPRAWVMADPAVVSNIPLFLPAALDENKPAWHHFRYQAGAIVGYERRPLPAEVAVSSG